MREVIVVGDANVDIIVPYPRFLDDKRTLAEYPTPELQGGGTAANTAVALARLGVDTAFVGTVGNDQYGRFVTQDMREAEVDVSGLICDSSLNTVGVFAFVDDQGERYLWGWPRVDQSFKVIDPVHVDIKRIRHAGWVHSSGMSMTYDTSARSTIIHVFEQAHAAGVPTSFDLNLRVDNGALDTGFADALRRIIPYTTCLLGSGPDEFTNLSEPGVSASNVMQTMADTRSSETCPVWLENARRFASDSRVVVARDGAKGSIGLTGREEIHVPAFSIEVEDTLGAGDVYNAGFISAMMRGLSLREALVIGNAVAAYTVARKGSRNSPDVRALSAFLDNHDCGVSDIFSTATTTKNKEVLQS